MEKNQVILREKNFNRLKDQVKKLQSEKKEIIFTSEDDDLNRKVLEKLPIDILLINQQKRKDFQKQRSSGLNQVLAKIAKKNKISIGINLDELISPKISSKEKSQIIARIKQNIILCNKNKVQMKFLSNKSLSNSYDLKSLGLTLGMPTWMTKDFNLLFPS